jgi:glycosyltransferase involved in cell wall biosynthesis
MNILLLCNKFPYPAHDGSAQAILHTLKALFEAGHQVTVLALNTVKHPGNPNQLPTELQQWARWVAVEADTTPHWTGALRNLASNQSYVASRFDLPAYRKALLHLLKEASYDIVQLEGLFMGHYLPELKGITTVLRAHNVEHRIWKQQALRTANPLKRAYLGLQWRRLARWEKRISRSVNGVLAISEEDRQWFEPLQPRTTAIGIPFDPQMVFQPIGGPPQFHYLASFDWIPNREGLVWFLEQVWPKYLEQVPEAEFHLAGRGLPSNLLTQLPRGVCYHGVVEDPLAFSAAHGALVVPLWVGSGLRIKVGQALAWGIPIVSTSIGVEGYALAHGREFLRADTPEEWLMSMVQLGENQPLQAQMSKAAVAYAQKHLTSAAHGAAIGAFYQSLRP